MKTKSFTIITFIIIIFISACAINPAQISTQIVTTTPSPSAIPQTATPTTDWFPVTATSPALTTQTLSPPTPTPIFIGSLILKDEFDQPNFWDTSNTIVASSSIENNKLTLSVNQPAQITTMRNQPSLDNFRMDVKVTAKICGTNGSYGIIFRSSNPSNFYRFVINCDKTIEIQRILNGNINHIMEPIYNPVIPTNLSEKAQISIVANGINLDIYINHLKMISISDKYHTFGSIGFFAQTSGDQPMTANFSDLEIYSLK